MEIIGQQIPNTVGVLIKCTLHLFQISDMHKRKGKNVNSFFLIPPLASHFLNKYTFRHDKYQFQQPINNFLQAHKQLNLKNTIYLLCALLNVIY